MIHNKIKNKKSNSRQNSPIWKKPKVFLKLHFLGWVANNKSMKQAKEEGIIKSHSLSLPFFTFHVRKGFKKKGQGVGWAWVGWPGLATLLI